MPGPTTKHQHRIPKGRPPRHRTVWTCQARSVPRGQRPRPSVRPSLARRGSARSDSRSSPRAPALVPGHPKVSPRARGALAPRAPHSAAREATQREEGLRPPRASPYTATYRHPTPQHAALSAHPPESRVPQHTHTPTLFPRPNLAALPAHPDKHTARIKTSASSRLGDSDGRQRVRDTFATAVKEHRVGAIGGAGALLPAVSAPGPALPAPVRAPGSAPSPSSLQAPGPSGQPRRAHPTEVGRKGDEERPQPSHGVCVRGSGGSGRPRTWGNPGDPHPRGGRASHVAALLLPETTL